MHICKVLFMPDCLSLVWNYSAHFVKFPILRFSKRYSFNSFHQISTKLHTKYHNRGLVYCSMLLLVLEIYQKLKILWRFEIFVNTEPYRAENFKTLLLQQFSSDPIQTLGGHCLPWGNVGYYSSWQFGIFYIIYGTLEF